MKAGSVSLLGLAVVAALVLVALVPQAMQAGQGIGSAVEEFIIQSYQIEESQSLVVVFVKPLHVEEEHLKVTITANSCGGVNFSFRRRTMFSTKTDKVFEVCLHSLGLGRPLKIEDLNSPNIRADLRNHLEKLYRATYRGERMIYLPWGIMPEGIYRLAVEILESWPY